VPASVAHVDLDAIAHNVGTLSARAGDALFCAVVKADGYGHGAEDVARAALAAGAQWLAVAHVAEARRLRAAGIDAPVLLLSEPRPDEIDHALALRLRLTVCQADTIAAVAERARSLGVADVALHLKVDTGMRRIGCEPGDAVDLAGTIVQTDGIRLEGTMTHLARADEPDDPTTDHQLDSFERTLGDLAAAGIDPGLRHAANSAGTIAVPRSHLDLVRVGIALYGISPAPALDGRVDLRPALRWTSSVSLVKAVRAGEGVSYGHRHRFEQDTVVATVPVGYADGVRRRLGVAGGQVLIRGRRRPMVGVVTMDQFVVDCGPGSDVEVGDEVVLIGLQGDEGLSAEEWGERIDTIGYEIVCGISARVPRQVVER
jgi:alanine racemase